MENKKYESPEITVISMEPDERLMGVEPGVSEEEIISGGLPST